MIEQVLFVALGLAALAGGVVVVSTKNVTRLALGLAMLFVALAGLFAVVGYGFVALAEIFIYVGGVLVIVLFALMLVHRSEPGRPSLETRHDLLAGVACAGIFGLGVAALRSLGLSLETGGGSGLDDLGSALLGPLLPQFEFAGLVLLAALVAVVAISAGEDR